MACGQAGPLELDLSDLLSADAAGLEALQRVQARGAALVGVPGYIQLQLAAPSRIPQARPRRQAVRRGEVIFPATAGHFPHFIRRETVTSLMGSSA